MYVAIFNQMVCV